MIIKAHLQPGRTFQTITYHDPKRGMYTLCYRFFDADMVETHPDVADWNDILDSAKRIPTMSIEEFYVEGKESIDVVTVALTREIDRNLDEYLQMMK